MLTSGVLLSGGLDSAVLLALELRDREAVQPIQIRSGLAWEAAEAEVVRRLLASPPFLGRSEPLRTLTLDMLDVYPATHWAVTGQAPAYDTPDEDVYLLGRNITLTAKASVLCARLGVSRLVLGPLAGNPFPDATPQFFAAMGQAMSLGLDHALTIAAPLATMDKAEVIRLGVALGVPFEHTLSCMSPVGTEHCGRCSKCRERQEAFTAAGVIDPASYAVAALRE